MDHSGLSYSFELYAPEDSSFLLQSPKAKPVLMNDEMLSGNGGLIELDANELESLLSYNQPSDYFLDSNFESITSSELLKDLDLMDMDDLGVAPLPEEAHDENKNILLISIPSSMQEATVFDKLPSILLEPNAIQKINEASAGYNGVYLPSVNQDQTYQVVQETPIIRRPPLQIIHQVSNQLAKASIVEKPKVVSGKRKQQFKLTRDDGIVFPGESSEPSAMLTRSSKELEEEFFWVTSDDEDTDVADETSVVEFQRCPGCQKLFKKLSFHRCKANIANLNNGNIFSCNNCKKSFKSVALLAEHKLKHDLICAFCKKVYKTKKGLIGHFKICSSSAVPQARKDKIFASTQVKKHVPNKNKKKTERALAKIRTRSSKRAV